MNRIAEPKVIGIGQTKYKRKNKSHLKLEVSNNNSDLNKLFNYEPNKSFLIRVKGDSMINAGISSGDVVLIDESSEAVNGDIIMASVNGNNVIKRLKRLNGSAVYLLPDNPEYKEIKIEPTDKFKICGVVIKVIKLF